MSLGTVTPPLGKNTPGQRSDWFPRVLRGYRGGSYMGTVAELQSARIMHGHLCREPQTTIDEEPTGAMASSQSCGLSVAHPWLMLWELRGLTMTSSVR